MTDTPIVPEPASAGRDLRSAFHRELEQLRTDLLRLGAMTCETVPRGTEILLSGELGGAQDLIDGDDEIDGLSVDLEERCFTMMTLQSPVAGDLRHLITAIKLVAELERSADLMVNVSKAARRMYGSPMSPSIRGVIASMAKEAQRLLQLSLDAYADGDAELAEALDDIDDQLDQLNRDMVEAIFSAHAEGQIDLAAAVQLALIARYYERIGDHAVNIGHRVTYMVTGWLPEHTGALRAASRHSDDEIEGDDADPADAAAPTDATVPADATTDGE